jgi:hypothetical protein
LFNGNARLEASGDAPVMRSPRWDRWEEFGWIPNIDIGRKFRLRGQYADYLEAAVREPKCCPIETLPFSEIPFPKAETDHRDFFALR